MDSADPLRASGLPCSFRKVEVRQGGTWVRATNVIPRGIDRIRSIGD
jgi:hypothetical protein